MLTSCVDQEVVECSNGVSLSLKLSYTNNALGTDMIGDLSSVSLYVFDSQGVLIQKIDRQGADFTDRLILQLSPGVYTFVAWGGEQSSSSYQVSPFTMGVTTKDQLHFKLNTPILGVLSTKPSDLFYGTLTSFEVTNQNATAEISLAKNTKNITVNVKNIDTRLTAPPVSLPHTAFDIFETTITGNNANYKFDNSLDISTPADANVTYIPYTKTYSLTDIQAVFRIMRLTPVAETRAPGVGAIRLKLTNTATTEVMRDIDLVGEIIAKHPLIAANIAAGLVKYSDFTVDIIYLRDGDPTSANVYVTIGDWTVKVIDVDME